MQNSNQRFSGRFPSIEIDDNKILGLYIPTQNNITAVAQIIFGWKVGPINTAEANGRKDSFERFKNIGTDNAKQVFYLRLLGGSSCLRLNNGDFAEPAFDEANVLVR